MIRTLIGKTLILAGAVGSVYLLWLLFIVLLKFGVWFVKL